MTINTTKHTSGVGGCFFKSGARDTPWFTSSRLWRFFVFFFEYGLGGRQGEKGKGGRGYSFTYVILEGFHSVLLPVFLPPPF